MLTHDLLAVANFLILLLQLCYLCWLFVTITRNKRERRKQ